MQMIAWRLCLWGCYVRSSKSGQNRRKWEEGGGGTVAADDVKVVGGQKEFEGGSRVWFVLTYV